MNIPVARARNRKAKVYFHPLLFSPWDKAATSKQQDKRHCATQDITRNI